MAEQYRGEIIIVGKEEATGPVQRVTRGLEGLRDVVAGLQISRIFEQATATVTNFARDSVAAFTAYQSAQQGVIGVATAFHQDINGVKKAIQDYTADGLVPLTEASNAFKNLMSSGFNLQQTIDLLNAAKDTASFNRQSFFTLGEAVDKFTQGIKNQNSILSDSAGVQKNLSVILQESGMSMQDLTDKVKGAAARQALYMGILKESAFAAGDHVKVLNTLSGQFSRLSTSVFLTKAKIGELIADGLAPAIKTLTDLIDSFRAAIPDIIKLAKQFEGLALTMALIFAPTAIAAIVRWSSVLLTALDAIALRIGGPLIAALNEYVAVAELSTAATVALSVAMTGLLAGVAFGIPKIIEFVSLLKEYIALKWPENNPFTQVARAEDEFSRKSILLGAINQKLGTSFTDLNEAIKAHQKYIAGLAQAHEEVVKQTTLSTKAQAEFGKLIEKFGKTNIAERVKDIALEFAQLQDKTNGFSRQAALQVLADQFKSLVEDARTAGVVLPESIRRLAAEAAAAKATMDELNKATEYNNTLEKEAIKELNDAIQKRKEHNEEMRNEVFWRGIIQDYERRQKALEDEHDERKRAGDLKAATDATIRWAEAHGILIENLHMTRQKLEFLQQEGILPLIADIRGYQDALNVLAEIQKAGIVLTDEQTAAIKRQGEEAEKTAQKHQIATMLASTAMQFLTQRIADAILRQGQAFGSGVKAVKKFVGDMIAALGQAAIADGAIKVATSIWPPNPVALHSGLMEIAAGVAALGLARLLGAGGAAAPATAGGAAAGAGAPGAGVAAVAQPTPLSIQINTYGPVVGSMAELAREFADALADAGNDGFAIQQVA